MKLRYTIFYVEQVEASLAFYERAFGFQRGFLHEGGDWGELVTGETKLSFCSRALLQSMGKAPAKADPKAPVFEIALETDDVPAAWQKAIDAGAINQQGPEEMPWGQTVAYVSDPDGYLVEICTPVSAA